MCVAKLRSSVWPCRAAVWGVLALGFGRDFLAAIFFWIRAQRTYPICSSRISRIEMIRREEVEPIGHGALDEGWRRSRRP